MRLYIDNRDEALVLTKEMEHDFRDALQVALRAEHVQETAEISLSFVNGEEIQQLNRDYRGKDAETDVLSFPVYEASEIEPLREAGALDVLGDIVINMNRVRSQALEYGHSEEREMLYLAVHSLLHLLGYDHEVAEEKAVMRAREEAIMEAIGQSREGIPAGEHAKRDEENAAESSPEEMDREAGAVEPNEGPAFHSGYVALIGRPNVGKSTLINALLGEKLSIVSNKPQTTRQRLQFIYTDEAMQAIFLDTPGVQIPKNELGEAMLRISEEALEGVDLCLFVTDVSKRIGPLDQKILDRMRTVRNVPIVMLLNKIDQATPAEVAAETARYEQTGVFRAILPISAKTQQRWEPLLSLLYAHLPEGPMYYPEDMITDRSERFLISEIIREKCLEQMQDEIPHGIHVEIEDMKMRPDGSLYDIYATIYCEKPSHKGMIIGKGGSKLGAIGRQARKDIEHLVDDHVNLKLWVKVDKNWRRKEQRVKKLGFE